MRAIEERYCDRTMSPRRPLSISNHLPVACVQRKRRHTSYSSGYFGVLPHADMLHRWNEICDKGVGVALGHQSINQSIYLR